MRKSFTRQNFHKALVFSALHLCFFANLNAQISGVVFRDFNGDGVKAVMTSSSLEPGVKGITVTAYPATGTLQTTTTDNSGNYSFSGLTLPVRIEFTNLPNGTYVSSFGSGSGTSVQFYSAATSDANLGINNPAHYSQANPDIITPKHLTGDPLASSSNMSSESALYKFPNTASGDAQSGGTPLTTMATQAQIGSTWGVAYERVRKKLFMSSVYRRHAPLGPGETGGRIYVIDNANTNTPGTPTKFIDLVSDLGISVGTIETNVARGLPDNKFIASEDNNTFSAAGKVGLGDIDISDDGQFLFVVNLFDKKVYKIDIAQAIAGTPNAVALPDFTLPCSNGSSRPWGLGMWDGELYLGVVCDALSGTSTDLRLTVQKYNFTSASWTEVLNVTPDWEKGDAIFGSAKHKWQKWEDVWDNFASPNWPVHPQPIISDIEFDEEGSMHLAVLDRTGFQAGHRQNKSPSDGGLYSCITAGELLRTYKDPTTGIFSLESNGSCGPYTSGGTGSNSQTGQGGPNTLQGPGGGEFYCDDHTGNNHSETTSGGLSFLKGSRSITSVQMDPIDGQLDAQGIVWFNSTNGLESQEYQVFYNGGTPSPDFSKQNGLGDLEFLSDSAPIEIGNRVFMDTDSDGEQDADEMGIDGVVVELWKAGSKAAETTTANGGQWYFSNVDINTDYEVKILAASFPSGKSLTTSNTASNAKDLIDSDASLVGADAVIAYKTGSAGQNNHNLDFGFKAGCSLTASATGTNVKCNAGTDGTATATPTGNTGAVTYAWSNGATTDVVTGLVAGVYTVTVTETPTCTATASVTITEPTDLTLACTKTDVTTTGGNDGTATVAASGGTAPYTYLWSNAATTASISSVTAGTYTVTVTDANGCSDICSSQVNEPGCNLTASATGTNAKCNAGTDGTATATPTGNVGAVTYLWSNTATTASLTGLSAGTYTVTVTESANCSATASYTVTEPSDITLACTKTDVTTTGGNDGTATVAASGGTAPYTYLWSNAATTASISSVTAGTYTVTVTDANGCSDICSSQVNEPGCNLTASATGTNVKCNAGTDGTATATPTGNVGAVTYVWSNGATTNVISGLTAGTYNVTVTETANCKATANYTVTEPSDITLTCTKTDVTTTGGNDGTATVAASGGTAPYTYLWSNGATTATVSSLTAGSYTVTVTDANACTKVCSSQVNEQNTSCTKPNAGPDQVLACANQVSPTTATLTAAPAGTTWSVLLQPANVVASISQTGNVTNMIATGRYLFLLANNTDNTCKDTVEIRIKNCPELPLCGTDKYELNADAGLTMYQWFKKDIAGTTFNPISGETNASITVSTAGSYTWTAKDANGCVISACDTVKFSCPCALTVTTTNTNVSCNAGTDGTATATTTGNVGAVTYLWSNGQITNPATGLAAGVYTVTVSETPTCSTTSSVTITEPADLTLACTKTDVTITGGNDGTATVTPTGGTAPYTYLWSNGATTASITGLISDIYYVTVTDAKGCSKTCSSVVIEPGCALAVSATSTNVSCNAGTDATATVTPSGNVGAVTYLWSNNATTASISGLAAGVYTVTVTETPTCSTTSSVTITEPADLTLACTKTDVTITGGNDGTATVTPTGGTAPYTYLWSNGATTGSITALTAGTYTVTVTDAKGCTDVCSSVITAPTALGSLGDLIWKDLNNDGIQNNGEVGVAGVTVELFNATTNASFATTTTDGTGLYTFANLQSGDYYVKFSVPTNMPTMELSSKQNVPTGTEATDNDFDATGKSDTYTIDILDPTKKDITTVDGAIVNKPLGSLGDLIWKDLNNDGIQNNGEVGVAGVTVELFNATTNASLATTTTDGTGLYTFANLQSGDYYVKFSVPTNMPTMELSSKQNEPTGTEATDNDFDATGKSDTYTIDILDPTKKDITTVDGAIVNKPLGSLGDLIWKDLNNDGIQNNGEVGVAGVTVELFNATTNASLATTTTDGTGLYTFANLQSGDYYVKFSVPTNMPTMELSSKQNEPTGTEATDNDFDATGKSDTYTIDILDPTKKDITTVDGAIVNKPLGSLGDLIWKDLNDDGVQDANETGVAGVTVELYDNATPSTPIKTTVTGTNGEYLFTDLVSGDYFVKISVPANMTVSMELSTKQNLGGDDATDNDFDTTGKSDIVTIDTTDPTKTDITTVDGAIVNKLVVLGSLGDLIWKDLNDNGVQDANETGVAGVTVELYDNATPSTPIKTTVTGTNGEYLFTDLVSGDYFVKISVPANMTVSMELSTKQNLGGDDATDNDFDTTGKSDIVTIDTTDPTKTDITTVDGAIVNKLVVLGSLGDLIWKDLNDNGVQDANETGVAGVTVELYDNATPSTPIKTTVTGTNGEYLFTDLVSGDYFVKISVPANMTVSMELSTKQNLGGDDATDNDFDTTGKSDVVTIDTTDPTKKDITTVDGAIVNKPLGSLGDLIWKDLNNDGIQNNGEVGVAGVTVELFNATTNASLATTTTDGTGLYTFANLQSGDYYVKFSVPTNMPTMELSSKQNEPTGTEATDNDFDATGKSDTYTIDILDPTKKDITTVDGAIVNKPLGSLGDLIWKDLNNDGIQNNGEVGVAGVTVELFNATTNASLATTTTDGTGLYTFANLQSGDYYVKFSVPTNMPTMELSSKQNEPTGTEATDNDFDATGKSDTYTIDILDPTKKDITTVDGAIVNKPLGSLGDLIWKDLNNDGIQNNGEVGVAGVTVELFNATTNASLATTTTDGTGLYTFANLQSGDYYVKFSVPTNMPTMELSSKQNEPTGTEATDNDFDATGKSDTYTIDILDPTKKDITTVDGAIVNKPLGSLGDLIWKDLNNDGIQNNGEVGVAGVTVELFNATTNASLATTTTDGTGLYTFANLQSGDYYVKFSVPTNMPTMELSSKQNVPTGTEATDNDFDATGKSDTYTIDILDPAKKDITTVDGAIVNKPVLLGSIGDFVWKDLNNNGLQDATEQGVAGIEISLFKSTATGQTTGSVLATATTDANGAYLFANLPAGDYVLQMVPSSIMTTMELSPKVKDPNGNDANDNDFSPVTWLTPKITVDPTDPAKKDITTVDGAIINKCTISAGISAKADVKCNASTDGSLTVTATGNIGTVTYVWSNGATTATIIGLIAGTYTVTVSESATCFTTVSGTITEPAAIALTCAKTNVTTVGGTDGTASVVASGGTAPYAYVWSNGSTTASITGLIAGTYSVTVTDANGCTSQCSSTVNAPGCNLLTLITNTVQITCNGAANGSITADVTGNLSPVTYLWSNGTTTATISNLAPGVYTVTATESATCKNTATQTITEPTAVVLVCNKTDVTTANGSDGTAGVSASGGTSPYTYIWSNGATTASINGLVAGTYTVTVTDSKGCTKECSSVLTAPQAVGSIGDYVWMDMNYNGIQEVGEPAVQGVVLELYSASNLVTPIKSDTTDAGGQYLFANLTAGDYIVKAISSTFPNAKIVTKKDTTNDDKDSDFDPTTYESIVITLNPSNTGGDPLKKDNPTIDLGLYQVPANCPVKICSPVKVTKVK